MQEAIQKEQTDSVSLAGLEEVFEIDTTVIEKAGQADSSVVTQSSKGLTIREASGHYGFAIPTIRLKIKTGEIPATKVNGPKGPEWRIFPSGIPVQCDDPDITFATPESEADSTVSTNHYEADRSLAEGFHQANINVASLIKANQDLAGKLEALTYRNGYLEAQAETHKEQIKLLTDSQHKAAWWRRAWCWFVGR